MYIYIYMRISIKIEICFVKPGECLNEGKKKVWHFYYIKINEYIYVIK